MSPTTLVVGLGNPILGDDGVGWRVAETVRAGLDDPDVEVVCLALGGLALMERLTGYRRALIVDALIVDALAGDAPLGHLQLMTAAELAASAAQHTASAHDLSLAAALALGDALGIALPEEIRVLGVVTAAEFEFGESLSARVAPAVPAAARAVRAWLAKPAGS